jgi:hypothetical protein
MQTPQLRSGDKQKSAVHIREQEPENFKALIHEIWHRLTEQHIEMRRSRSVYQIDASMNP